MTIYNNNGLTNDQNFRKNLFSTPEGSLTEWGVNNIDWYYRNTKTKVHFQKVAVMVRLNSIAMPIFALLDTFQFLRKSLYKAVTLRPKDALYDLLRCGKSLQLFITTLLVTPVALFTPGTIYVSEQKWIETQQDQNYQYFKKCYMEQDSSLEIDQRFSNALKQLVQEYFGDNDSQACFQSIVEEMVKSLPRNSEEEEKAVDQSFMLLSQVYTKMLIKKINLETVDKSSFQSLFSTIFNVRMPTLREQLVDHLISQLAQDPEILKHWEEASNDIATHSTHMKVMVFQTLSLIDNDLDLEEDVLRMVKNNYFKTPKKAYPMMNILQALINKELLQDEKIQLLKHMVEFDLIAHGQSYVTGMKKSCNKDKANFSRENKKNEQKAKNKLNWLAKVETGQIKDKESGDIIEFTEHHRKGREESQKILDEIEEKRQVLTQKENRYKNFDKQINDFKDKYQIQTGKKKSNKHMDLGIAHLETLMSIQETKIISECLSRIKSADQNELYLISNPKILLDLFKEVFSIDKDESSIEKVQQLRSLARLITFYSRLKELSEPEREVALKVYRDMVISYLDGTFHKKKHSTENNFHLETIFNKCSGLEEKWSDITKTYTVQELVENNPNPSYLDFKVQVATDITDILSIGIDMGHCLNLYGRLERVFGLGAIAIDGKIHEVIVKNSNTGKIVAETRLRLLWDDKNEKPVLYMDYIECHKIKENDKTLREAVRQFCYREADRLGIDIVSLYGPTNRKRYKVGEKYQGTVKALGGPAPTEYVNYYYENKDHGVYEFPETYVLHKASYIRQMLL